MSIQKFVADKLIKLDEEHKQYVKKTYHFHTEYTKEEYEEMISAVEEDMMKIPEELLKCPPEYSNEERDRYMKMVRSAWVNDHKREIELIKRDMKRAEEYKLYRQQKEIELSRYPKSNDDVIRNLKIFINEKVNYYHKDLIDSYFDMFVSKIRMICPKDKDYSRTIASVYQNKNSKKAMNILTKFFDTMKNELLKLSLNVKGIQSDLYFTMEKLLKGQFLKLIELMHTIIYNFLQMKIDYVDDSEEMSDSRAVKLYAETCMSQLNDMLMNELPELLNEEFKIAVEDRVEDLSCRWKREIGCDFGKAQKQIEQESTTMGFQPEVQRTMCFQPEVQRTIVEVNGKPLVADIIESANKVIKEVSIESFLELLPNDLIEVNELAKMYNNYFGTSKTARGFGMLNDIKGKFVKTSDIISGKRITYYRKTRRV